MLIAEVSSLQTKFYL